MKAILKLSILAVLLLIFSGCTEKQMAVPEPTPIQTTNQAPETPIKTTAPTPTPTPLVGSYGKPASVGTMIADDEAEFTVLEVNRVSRSLILGVNRYASDVPLGFKPELVKIQIKNIGTKELTVTRWDIKAFVNGTETPDNYLVRGVKG